MSKGFSYLDAASYFAITAAWFTGTTGSQTRLALAPYSTVTVAFL